MKIKIDPEFSGLIPATTAESDAEFERAVQADGEIFEPLIVWEHQNILLDGHRRNRLMVRHPTLKSPKPVVIKLESRQQAHDWIIHHQLSKRNVSEAQRRDLIGALYKNRKQDHGGDRKSNQAPNSALDPEADSTAAEIGKAHGISEQAVRRAEDFHEAVHSLEPETQKAILSGDVRSTSTAVEELAELPPKKREAAEKKIKSGKVKSVRQALPKRPPKKKVHRADAPIKRAQVDDNRAKVPEELLEVFEARDEFSQIYRELWSLAARIKSLKAKPAGRHIRSDEGDVVERVAERVTAACPSILDEGKGWLPAGAVE